MQRIILLAGCFWFVGAAQAGTVFRCTDADTGAQTFSDVPCSGEVQAIAVPEANVMDSAPIHQEMRRQAEARKAKEEMLREREARSAEVVRQYNEKKRRKDCANVVRPYKRMRDGRLTTAQLDYLASCKGLSSQGSDTRASTTGKSVNECRQMMGGTGPDGQLTRGQLDFLARCQGFARLPERPSTQRPITNPVPPPTPSVITNCDTTGCWDNLGTRYNHGAGPTFIRQDGKACTGVGGQMNCP